MNAYQITAGFSDIKSELQSKIRTTQEIRKLWFSCQNDEFYVHNYFDHKECIILALCSEDLTQQKVYLPTNGYGHKLVVYIMAKHKMAELARKTNELYLMHGYY